MMSEKKKMVPQLRFPGFSGEWEERKFSDYYKMCSGYAFKYQDYVNNGVTIINGESIQHGKIFSAKFNYLPESFRKDYSDFLLNEGDIVVGLNRPITEGKLKISRVPRHLDSSLLYQRAGKIKCKTYIDANFSYVLLEKEILKHTLKEAVGSDQPFISTSKLDKWKIMFPKSGEERAQIGLIFNHHDNLIILHQRKLTHLQARKKGLLQKMFPKDGELFPELRFPGFTDAWEQRQLSEVAEQTFGGGTPKTSVDEYWSGEIPWIQSSDLTDGKVYGVVPNKTISEAGLNNSATKLIPANSIALITRVGVGKLAFMTFSYATSQDFLSLSSLKIDPWFCVYSCYKKLQSELHVVQGTSIKGITKDELLAKKIPVPVIEEQAKIGAFFKQLDDSITLHQRKLDHLQTRKKALLQQLFV